MAGRHVTHITSCFDQNLTLTRFQRLNHDLRIIPTGGALTACERKQQAITTGEKLWPMGGFGFLERDNRFRLTAISRDSHNPFTLANVDVIIQIPSWAEIRKTIDNVADSHGGSTADRNLLKFLFGPRHIAQPAAIRGEENPAGTLRVCSLNRSDLRIADVSQVKLLIAGINDFRTIWRNRYEIAA